MSGHHKWSTVRREAETRRLRGLAARDGEEIAHRDANGDWILTWHPPPIAPEGIPHGAAGICVTDDGGIVLISEDGERWSIPGGRPEGNETPEATLRREMWEEACATVVAATLLGFSRGECIAGSQTGRVIVRSLWRAEVELAPWEPQFEIAHRRVVAATDVVDTLAMRDGNLRIICRALDEAARVASDD